MLEWLTQNSQEFPTLPEERIPRWVDLRTRPEVARSAVYRDTAKQNGNGHANGNGSNGHSNGHSSAYGLFVDLGVLETYGGVDVKCLLGPDRTEGDIPLEDFVRRATRYLRNGHRKLSSFPNGNGTSH